jgi:hypothetical protein
MLARLTARAPELARTGEGVLAGPRETDAGAGLVGREVTGVTFSWTPVLTGLVVLRMSVILQPAQINGTS